MALTESNGEQAGRGRYRHDVVQTLQPGGGEPYRVVVHVIEARRLAGFEASHYFDNGALRRLTCMLSLVPCG